MLQLTHPIGRPSLFTTELGDEICNRIADGESLRAICENADMPHKATVFRWLLAEQHKDFCNQYIRARDIQADVLFDEIHQITDTQQKGAKTVRKQQVEHSGPDGGPVTLEALIMARLKPRE